MCSPFTLIPPDLAADFLFPIAIHHKQCPPSGRICRSCSILPALWNPASARVVVSVCLSCTSSLVGGLAEEHCLTSRTANISPYLRARR
ncbi:hypothetical protein FIBSPDRAFT_861813 [Athelia psychrophila]|uniref:Uncharacterized protein n=1 Tax=Athelia psychrophila TaxID=1759441 RepID=A0A166IYB4_9AGAM|nr:hypothetical protein FIBSPDRAFT_861813 [Fibularhizoctonia sp. CBS 109695]